MTRYYFQGNGEGQSKKETFVMNIIEVECATQEAEDLTISEVAAAIKLVEGLFKLGLINQPTYNNVLKKYAA